MTSASDPIAGCRLNPTINLTSSLQTTSVTAAELAASHRCEVAVNAGFFNTKTGACHGAIVSRGAIVQDSLRHNARFGLTAEGRYCCPQAIAFNGALCRFLVGYFNVSDFNFVEVVTGATKCSKWLVLMPEQGWSGL